MPRRLVATAPHVLAVEEYEPQAVGPTQVRVRSEYASGKHGTAVAIFDNVNFAGQKFDLEMRLFQTAPGAPAQAAPTAYATPQPQGTTAVGVVEEVGADVTGLRVGDRVVGLMKVAEQNVVDAKSVWLLGDADPVQALCIEPGYVSIHAIREGQIRFGDTVAVIGLGAIGLIAVQMASRAGAGLVVAVDPLAKRREWALAHGADAVLDPTTDDVPLAIHELTGGAGVDVAIEASGSYHALEAAIKSTRMRGTVSAAGFYQGGATPVWLGREFHHNRITLVAPHGCGWGHEPRDYPRWDEYRTYAAMVEMLQRRRLDLDGLIDPIVGLDEMPDTWRRIEDDPGSVIKYGVRFA